MEVRKDWTDDNGKVEILPPPPKCRARTPFAVTCLSCRKPVERSEHEAMEYGICEECIGRA